MNPTPIEPCGIKLLNANNARPLVWGKVNHHFAEVLNPALEELADHGAIAIYTYGIRNNRPIRGRENRFDEEAWLYPFSATSTHSSGQIRWESGSRYKLAGPWRDGSVGALGFDVRKILFRVTAMHDRRRKYRDPNHIDISLVCTDPGDRKSMIKWCEGRGFRVYHKKPLSHADHMHIQPMNLQGVT